ncbi:MAG: glycerophosphodiester phosphodiesterase family protein [Pedobacter sp.]
MIFLRLPFALVTFCLLSATTFAQTVHLSNGVTAHRGYSAAYPENTMTAFREGIMSGADWVELDIHKTSDGKIVVSHDGKTGRTSGKDLIIANSTYKELQELDVATEFRTLKGLTLKECPIQRMPLLEDALKLILNHKRSKLSIQPKADCVADAIRIVRKLNAEHMVGFNDASLKYMSQVKELAPAIPVFWDRGPDTDINKDILIAKEKGFETLVINYKGINPDKVQRVKDAGLKVGTWTVSDKENLEQFIKLGLDRIYTDNPVLLIALKKSQVLKINGRN